jgi:hypothetical protein
MDILVLSAALSISFAFVSNFLSRSIKGYVNLVRYSALHARCLDLITSDLKESPEDVQNLIRDIRQFDASFASPLKLSVALWKMFTELGYGLFFGILIVLQTFATVAWWEMSMSIPCLWFVVVIAFGPLWLAAEIVFLRYFSSYFRGASANWAEALRLR